MEKNHSCPTLIYLYTVNVNVGTNAELLYTPVQCYAVTLYIPLFLEIGKKVHCYRTLFQASLITAPSVTHYPCSTKKLYKLGVASDTKAEKFSAAK